MDGLSLVIEQTTTTQTQTHMNTVKQKFVHIRMNQRKESNYRLMKRSANIHTYTLIELYTYMHNMNCIYNKMKERDRKYNGFTTLATIIKKRCLIN